ncbi:MAG: Kelch repeat-containing protein [Candidatus Latescibacterota bacterium]|jgi:hypothetical protein
MTARLHMIVLLSLLLSATSAYAQQWRQLEPTGTAPTPRNNTSLVYDPVGHRLIVFAGRSSAGDLNDLWALDLAQTSWIQFEPEGPVPNLKHGDTWSYDFVSGTWEQIALTGTSPIARNGAAGVYIERESRSLFFGGVGTEVRFNDVWALEGLAPPPPPTAVETTSWGKIKGHAAPEANKTQ